MGEIAAVCSIPNLGDLILLAKYEIEPKKAKKRENVRVFLRTVFAICENEPIIIDIFEIDRDDSIFILKNIERNEL